MKKISVIMLVFVMMMSFATAVFAGPAIDKIVKRGELIIGTSGDYPPFTVKTKDGKLMGLDIDLGMLIADVMEVKAKTVQMPFAELLPALQSGKIDMIISAMTIVPKRNLKVAFIGPYFVSGQSIMATKMTAMSVENLNDMNKPDFTLAVPGGTTSEMIAKKNVPKAQIKVAKDMNEAVKMLLDGKVKAVMSDTATCAVETVRYKEKNIVSTPPLTFEPIGIAIAENDPLFFNFLSNFLSGMRGSGDLEMITNKWFKDTSWIKDLP
ncbi:MAG: transporter substrate-binding domain-containing protein [Proteobacteria bacterium]|nr:transporter substrate-binding domain-containing protein [Pseudomonadota bacterium]